MDKKQFMKNAKPTGLNVAGGIIGGLVSRGAYGAIHTKKAVTAEDIKKENLYGYGKRAALIAVPGLISMAIKDDGGWLTFAKAALVGMSAVQGVELVSEAIASTPAAAKMATKTNALAKFASSAIGLACPCTAQLNGTRRRRRGMNAWIPTQDFAAPAQLNGLNILEASSTSLTAVAA